uniref:Odorant receptor n=1 Tax=Glossina brevipalpis TaxID=37001 RepID=A0A1A9WER3_9MUSC
MDELRTIEDVPLYQTSLRIMKFWSFLLQHNWRRYVCLIPYVMINATQFLDICYSHESIDAIVRNAYIAVLFFNTILRAVLLCINRFDYEKFMDNIRLLYIELTDAEDNVIRMLVRDTTTAAKNISKINLLMGVCSCVGFVIYPIFATSRVLPFGMYVPGIDKYESPFYEIFFALQIIITPMGCCMYIPFTNIIVAFILFAILMCKVMQHKLKQLQNVNDEKARETINELTTYTYLVEFLAFGAMLCAMLFLLIIVETIGQMIIIGIYIFMIFSQSVIMYYYANELYDQSLLVAEAAYDSDWFDFNVMTQKILHLLILRAQKPCAILIGKIYPMNLEMLQSLLNTTYSYFTLLKRLYG